MTHLAHLVRADARRFCVLLAVWVLLEIGDVIFRGVRPALAGDRRLTATFELLGTMLFTARWLGMIVIVALVVQTHALVGSDAFWMTRPIHWRTLLASKLVLLATTFVAVPALCETGLMLASRVPMSDIPAIALQTVLFQSLWLGLFMALAAITRNLARLALIAGSLLVGLILLINVLIAVMLRNMPDGPQLIEMTPRMMASPAPGVAMLILLIGTAIAVVAAQYRTRLVRLAIIVGAAGLAATILVALTWPWPVRPMPVPAWATRDAALRFDTASSQGQFRPLDHGNPWSRGGAWLAGDLELRVSGVEEGWRAAARLDSATVSFTDGTTLATAGNAYSSAVRLASVDAPDDAIALQVLGVKRLLATAPEHRSGPTATAIVLAQADFDKYQGATGTYRGQFLVDLDRLVVASTLPLQAGGVFQGHRHRIVIDQVNAQGPTAAVRLRQFTSASMFDAEQQPAAAFYLRNRSAAEAVAGSSRWMEGMSPGFGLMMIGVSGFSSESGTGFHIMSNDIQFPAGYDTNGKRVDLSAEWLSQAELVVLHTIPGGSVTRSVEVPGFQMTLAPRPTDPAVGARR